MERSPVCTPETAPIVRLNESHDLQSFQAELVRLVGAGLKTSEILFGFRDVDSKICSLPSWVRSHLERHASLQKKLEQGEMVGIGHGKEIPALMPANATRSSVIFIPVNGGGKLLAAIGLVSPLSGPQPSVEDIERIRSLARECSSIILRLEEVEKLRRENRRLAGIAEDAFRANKRFARLLEEKTALDAIIQMRSHLQVNVAHDLRTPLSAIRGYARMILDGRGREVNDTQKEYLRIVTENTTRLIDAVSWMSYMTGLGTEHYRLSTFDLREAWAECVDTSQPALRKKALKLMPQVPDEDFVIIGDREKLTEVLEKLIGAAVRFSDLGGTIAVEFSHGREKEVSVKISEKGASIPPDAIDKIFERSFNTIGKSTAQNMDAGAISLSSVVDIVGMHGGRIFVNSTAGQGATFLFTLPAVTLGGEENSHEQAVHSSSRRR